MEHQIIIFRLLFDILSCTLLVSFAYCNNLAHQSLFENTNIITRIYCCDIFNEYKNNTGEEFFSGPVIEFIVRTK